MHLRIRLANPAGNITLFVLDPVDPAARPALSAALMRRDPSVEQVAFVTAPKSGGAGRFEMMGGEFCGNACRAFGFLLARERFSGGVRTLAVEASGAASPVAVTADLDAGIRARRCRFPARFPPASWGAFAGRWPNLKESAILSCRTDTTKDCCGPDRRCLPKPGPRRGEFCFSRASR